MPQTAYLRRTSSGFANEPDTWWVAAGPDDWSDERGQSAPDLYVLPDGYTAEPGEPDPSMMFGGCLRDAQGRACALLDHVSGRPQVVAHDGSMPVLRLAA